MIEVNLTKVGEWKRVGNFLRRFPEQLPLALDRVCKLQAERLRSTIVKKIDSGPFKPLSKATLAVYAFQGKKHGGKPLIMHGDLRNGVKVVPQQGHKYFVGIPAAARNRTGQSLVRLAQVHEEGRTIVLKMTDKMRAFLFAAFAASGLTPPGGPRKSTGVLVITIPARPFMAPSVAAWQVGIGNRVTQQLASTLGNRMKLPIK